MLQIAICDDEQFYREKIRRLVECFLLNKDLAGEFHLFSSGEDFLRNYENTVKYDIVFMDISMDSLDGIRTAMQMRAFHSETFLVLVTAFIDYVLEGYKVNATRYLLKSSLEQSMTECMDAILRKMRTAQISFSFLEGTRSLYTDNILYVESRRHKAIFFYLGAELETPEMYCRLDEIEHTLSRYGFLRIHKSFLVNMKHIRAIRSYKAYLDTGLELPVPRLKFQAVKEAFTAYKGAI